MDRERTYLPRSWRPVLLVQYGSRMGAQSLNRAGDVGLYVSDVGLYVGDVGLYVGDVGSYGGDVGLYDGLDGLLSPSPLG